MALWNLLNINYIMALSTIVYIIHITATGMDIVFLKSLENKKVLDVWPNRSHLLLVQESKLAVFTALVLHNIVYFVTIKQKQVYRKILFGLMIVNFGLGILRNILNWLSIFIRLELKNEDILWNWIRFEIHPLTVLCQASLCTGMYMANLVWFLGFGLKHKMIHGTNKIFGVNLKSFLYLGIVFRLLHPILFTLNRTQMFLNDVTRNKIISEGGSIFITSSIILVVNIATLFWYYWDVVCGVKQNSYKRILRYYQWSLVLIPFFQPMRLLLSVQEHDIFYYEFNRGLLNCIIVNAASVLALAVHISQFVYSMHLKQSFEGGNKDAKNYKNISLTGSSFRVKIIPRKLIRVDNKSPIGSGHSSTVYSGTLQTSKSFWSKRKEMPVSIKVVWGYLNDSGISSVITEELRNMSRAMKQSEGHPNLVGFCGACFQNSGAIISPLGTVNIVMELCQNGSLDKYLVKMHEKLIARGGELSYQCSIQFVSWAEQIAKGMEFLAKQNIIHGDLAARNILLDGTLTAKISDFGMSRKLYDYQIYVSTQQTAFPWRWMAPESLDGLKFSTASDVWSYGVLLWELFSFGDSPWAEKAWSSDFLASMIAGDRLSKPIFASESLYNKIMLECWKIVMEERPTFSDLVERISSSNSGPSWLLLKCLTELSIV